jgi:hypothetical protein
MHTYKKAKDEDLWTVGHYYLTGGDANSSESRWVAMKDFSTEERAAHYVNYLNGGSYKRA